MEDKCLSGTRRDHGPDRKWSVLLVQETGVPGENHRPAKGHWQTLSLNVVSSTSRHERDSNSQHGGIM